MPNQYTKLSKDNVLRKLNRKRNPVTSVAQLAREFGYNTTLTSGSTAAPGNFRNRVKSLVGEKTYNAIRDERSVNLTYR